MCFSFSLVDLCPGGSALYLDTKNQEKKIHKKNPANMAGFKPYKSPVVLAGFKHTKKKRKTKEKNSLPYWQALGLISHLWLSNTLYGI